MKPRYRAPIPLRIFENDPKLGRYNRMISDAAAQIHRLLGEYSSYNQALSAAYGNRDRRDIRLLGSDRLVEGLVYLVELARRREVSPAEEDNAVEALEFMGSLDLWKEDMEPYLREISHVSGKKRPSALEKGPTPDGKRYTATDYRLAKEASTALFRITGGREGRDCSADFLG